MWIEDREDKIVREAKIKAHGACTYHRGHFDGNSYFNGIMTVVITAAVIAFIVTSVVGMQKSAVNEYAASHPPMIYYQSQAAPGEHSDNTQVPNTAGQGEGGSAYGSATVSTCDSNGNCHNQ